LARRTSSSALGRAAAPSVTAFMAAENCMAILPRPERKCRPDASEECCFALLEQSNS
jgi:hypothetical protein